MEHAESPPGILVSGGACPALALEHAESPPSRDASVNANGRSECRSYFRTTPKKIENTSLLTNTYQGAVIGGSAVLSILLFVVPYRLCRPRDRDTRKKTG